jgi:uncharacterized protein with von Willebrand factor type A (vWA) domain
VTDDRLIDFAGLLRQNGVRVSPGELATAAEALALVPFEDRESVRAALRATMVKRGADAPVFDRLFELYFGAMGRLLEGLEETLANGLKMDDLSLEEMQEVAKVLSELGASGGLAHSLVQGQLGSIAKLMRAAALKVEFSGLKSPLQKGFFARRVGTAAGLSEVAREFRLLEQALADKGIDPALVERVSRRLDDAIDALQETARRVTDLEYEARDAAAAEPGAVTKKSITSLTPAELQRMRDVVKRLAEKLKSRIARRRRERRRGQLNVRRTLRRNMSLGGVPARLSFRSRRPERPEIVVLCDVSDSVRNVSRLMLQFVHTLQSLYARVRSFVFVSDVGEVTALFKNASIDDAVDGAVAGKVINLAAHSNYGHALRLFHKDFKGAVTRRTTLVVIGDGRSNHNPANAWVLEDLRRQARRVVWICPEERAAWGFGDSEMPSFARHCDRVFPVQTVEDLGRAADELMP